MSDLTKEKCLAMECIALGCQRSVADKLIQELRRDLASYENAHKVLVSENQRLTAELLKEQLDFRAHLAGCKSEQAPEVQK